MKETEVNESRINVKMHTMCHKRFLSLLPSKYQSEDSNTLAIAYFSLASLELLGTLQSTFHAEELESFIDYIYSHYIESHTYAGFRGSLTYNEDEESIELAATCFSLQCLLILVDDLKRVNVEKVMAFVSRCQMESGGFTNVLGSEHEKDLRYCMIAATVSKILMGDSNRIGDYIDVVSLEKFVHSLQNYDGGFSMCRGDESHCGMVFCATDALNLIDHRFDINGTTMDLLDFLVHRQVDFGKFNETELQESPYADIDDNGGFNGRLNKYADTCYVFWALGSLRLIGCDHLIDTEAAKYFLTNKTQNLKMGGFNKTTDPDEFPDPLHSFLGLAALSILGHPDVNNINCQFVIPETSYEHWKSLHVGRR